MKKFIVKLHKNCTRFFTLHLHPNAHIIILNRKVPLVSKGGIFIKKKIIFVVILSFCLCLFTPAFAASAKSSPLKDLLCVVVLSDSVVTLDIGDTHTLFALASDGGKVTYKSSNSKIASVSAYGVIEAKKKGTVTITARRKKASAKCVVTVLETTIKLSKNSITLDCGEMTGVTASTSNNSTVKWKSSRPSIARVSEKGLITALKPGSCTVTASSDGSRALCNVTVAKPQITLSSENVSLYRGGTYKLEARVSSNRPVSYKSRKKSVATVSADGTITGVSHGTTTITVTVDGVSETCDVSVESPDITLSNDEITLAKGGSATLSAVVSSGQQPVWSSSNTSVVRVNKKTGKITAVSKGKAYIYASEDGAKARCRVIVADTK
ncbi:MAG: Ig-like domain-containing protein [Lachnospiraceae bacterium]|nr:Ig-like domain-containing protein [Lachnospiraceae bacterium]